MNEYEELLSKISEKVPVVEINLLEETGLEAAYEDNFIYLDKNLSWVQKRVNLAEEYGHHKTSVGEIIDYTKPENRKQEWKARRYSFDHLISLDDLLECHDLGITCLYDCAEHLSVTEEVLLKSFEHFQNKYGYRHCHGGKYFYFRTNSVIISDLFQLK